MNYIQNMNQFCKLQRRVHLSANEIALYIVLFDLCNSLKWSRPVSKTNLHLCKVLQISEHTLIRTRKRLLHYGLINFIPGDNSHNISRYSINDLSNVDIKSIAIENEENRKLPVPSKCNKTTAPGNFKTTAAPTAKNGAVTPEKNHVATTAHKTDYIKNSNNKNNNKKDSGVVNSNSTIKTPEALKSSINQTNPDFFYLIKEFNEKCSAQKRITKLDERRKNLLNDCISELGTDSIEKIINKVAASNFLAGENRFGWIAQFDWIFKPENSIKIIDGHYDNDAKAIPFNPDKPLPPGFASEARNFIISHDEDYHD